MTCKTETRYFAPHSQQDNRICTSADHALTRAIIICWRSFICPHLHAEIFKSLWISHLGICCRPKCFLCCYVSLHIRFGLSAVQLQHFQTKIERLPNIPSMKAFFCSRRTLISPNRWMETLILPRQNCFQQMNGQNWIAKPFGSKL